LGRTTGPQYFKENITGWCVSEKGVGISRLRGQPNGPRFRKTAGCIYKGCDWGIANMLGQPNGARLKNGGVYVYKMRVASSKSVRLHKNDVLYISKGRFSLHPIN